MNNSSYSPRSSRGGRPSGRSGGYNRNSNYRGGNRGRGRGGGGGRRRGAVIDPKRFVKAAKHVEVVEYVPKHSFEDFDINPAIKENLAKKGFKAPSQIQDQSIPVTLGGDDVIGIANTGTGKTAAFLIPILDKIMNDRSKKALIVAPTRELALQIEEECKSFALGTKIYTATLIGGVPIGPQIRRLKHNPEIIIGTPGRLKDHIERKLLRLDRVDTIVLDEVDRMLDMGFINDITTILKQLPEEKQSLFFSATISPTIERLINTFTHSPKTVMARTAETSDNVDQSVRHYHDTNSKSEHLKDILHHDDTSKVLIFCETKRNVEKLSKELVAKGYAANAIHGNKNQSQRQRALKSFRDGHIDILVATDVAARGIDVDDITHVINYEVPQTYDDYTHRIGRTGRGGKTGFAVTFVQKRQN